MPIPLMAGITALLGGWFARFVGVSVVRFTILKGMIWFLVMSLLPVVLYNLFSLILEEIMTTAESYIGASGVAPIAAELTGLLGWIAGQMQIPAAFSIILSAMVVRASINIIPFVRNV
jgi:hypothetical protein